MITEKDIKRISTLAKLEIGDEEIPLYIKEMETVLSAVDSIESALESEKGRENEPVDYNNLRNDEAKPSLKTEEIIANAKETEESFIKLRKRA